MILIKRWTPSQLFQVSSVRKHVYYKDVHIFITLKQLLTWSITEEEIITLV